MLTRRVMVATIPFSAIFWPNYEPSKFVLRVRAAVLLKQKYGGEIKINGGDVIFVPRSKRELVEAGFVKENGAISGKRVLEAIG